VTSGIDRLRTGIHLPHRRRPPATGLDAWERPATSGELRPIQGLAPRAVPPYRPRDATDVPAGALPALSATCGDLGASDLAVIPPTIRPIDVATGMWAVAPWRVIGVGPVGIGLWVQRGPDGGPGVRRTIPTDRVAAVDDRTVLLSARLRVAAEECGLDLWYTTVARAVLEPLVMRVRRAAADHLRPIPLDGIVGEPPGERPMKWRMAAGSPMVRLDPRAPATILFGLAPERPGDPSRPALVALTPHELVVAREPATEDVGPGYGFDALQVPRGRLEACTFELGRLRLRSAGCDLDVPLGDELSAVAADRLAGALAEDVRRNARDM
jgi:hypothetical protein